MNRGKIYLDEEIQYEDVDDSGNSAKEYRKPVADPARNAKTPLQARALASCRLPRFSSRPQHKAFKDVEQIAIGASNDAYLVHKWIENCISVWESANKMRTVRPLDGLISYMNNEAKRIDWIAKNQKRLLENRKKEGKESLMKDLLVKHDEEEVPSVYDL